MTVPATLPPTLSVSLSRDGTALSQFADVVRRAEREGVEVGWSQCRRIRVVEVDLERR